LWPARSIVAHRHGGRVALNCVASSFHGDDRPPAQLAQNMTLEECLPQGRGRRRAGRRLARLARHRAPGGRRGPHASRRSRRRSAAMRAGTLNVGTADGHWAFGLALFKESLVV
jgi:hypothetical protein